MRGSGVLLHISSLPNDYGIGTFGIEAYKFIDFLKNSRQKYWQVLPLGPTSFGDSPYQTLCAFAGNPYFIDFDLLERDGLLLKEDYFHLKSKKTKKVDYKFQFENRYQVLEKAFSRFIVYDDYISFKEENKDWLDCYAIFMSIKSKNGWSEWSKWDSDLKYNKYEAISKFKNNHHFDIEFWKFIQYEFFIQWKKLKKYANDNGVLIVGDIPIYVAYDSSDVWENPKYWHLDENLNPTIIAGVPPDDFSIDGQRWGNPIYNYSLMEEDGFKWWIRRFKKSFELYDIVRIDHFRGFESYYAIDTCEMHARGGKWIKGPGYKLFEVIKNSLGPVSLIAEDLGFITSEVYKLLDMCQFPGMKVLQFAFSANDNSEYLPHNHIKNCYLYPGTHDNSTLKGWIKTLNKDDYKYLKDYLQARYKNEIIRKVIIECFKSVADVTIIQMQDFLELDDDARMNTPSKISDNWNWRMKSSVLKESLRKRIEKLTLTYRR